MNTQAVLGRLGSNDQEEKKGSKKAKKESRRLRRIKRQREADDVAKRNVATEMIFNQNNKIKRLQRDLEHSEKMFKKSCDEASELRDKLLAAESEIARLQEQATTVAAEVISTLPVSSSQLLSSSPPVSSSQLLSRILSAPTIEEAEIAAEQHLISSRPQVPFALVRAPVTEAEAPVRAPVSGIHCRNLFGGSNDLATPSTPPTWGAYYGYRQR